MVKFFNNLSLKNLFTLLGSYKEMALLVDQIVVFIGYGAFLIRHMMEKSITMN